MKYEVIYRNTNIDDGSSPSKKKIKTSKRPLGELKIAAVYLVPIGGNMFNILISFNVRGVDVECYGAGGTFGDEKDPIYQSIVFSIDDGIWAEVALYPEIKAECSLDLFGSVSKTTYNGVMIQQKLLNRKWDEYCNRKANKR